MNRFLLVFCLGLLVSDTLLACGGRSGGGQGSASGRHPVGSSARGSSPPRAAASPLKESEPGARGAVKITGETPTTADSSPKPDGGTPGTRQAVGTATAQTGPTQTQTAPKVYSCPMHPEVKENGPGKCPKCGMTLIPEEGPKQQTRPTSTQPVSASYTCPMHPEVRQKTPGKCPKCGMTLQPAGEKR